MRGRAAARKGGATRRAPRPCFFPFAFKGERASEGGSNPKKEGREAHPFSLSTRRERRAIARAEIREQRFGIYRIVRFIDMRVGIGDCAP